MLNFIYADSGCGKTEFVFNEIKKQVKSGEKDILLMTPEQYNLVAEKRLLTDLGEYGIRFVSNTSFSRISDDVRRKYGTFSLPAVSKGGKAVLMMNAIEAARRELQLFNKKLDSFNFVSSMINVYDEMRSCNLSSSEILMKSDSISNSHLKLKMNDIALIMEKYEKIIENRFTDSADELTILYNELYDKYYFKDKIVYIDGFNGFVAQEYKLLELIIKESASVTITVCTDNPESDDPFNLFGYVNNTIRILKRIAEKAGVKVNEKFLRENYRAEFDDIRELHKNLFKNKGVLNLKSDNIELYAAKNISDECRQTARRIRTLLKSGVKAKEISVITRNIEKYRQEISSVFRKYEIPFFDDERQPIKNQPLIVFIVYLLRCISFSYRSDDILSMAKTGLMDICDEDIDLLENYVFMWNINGLKWTREFTASTNGFSKEISDSDRGLLKRINLTRSRIIAPVEAFKKSVKNASAKVICTEIYNTIIKCGADKMLQKKAVELSALNKTVLAEEQGRIWDLTMEILNALPEVIGDEIIKIKDFAKIFNMMVSAEDFASIPVGLDNVQFGQADRIRTDNPKAVFVLGANDGEFPKSAGGSSLLTENDRKILLENDFKLYSYGDIINLQERYFAYMACTASGEKVYISYEGNSEKSNSPSEIVSSVKSIFDLKEITYNDLSEIELIETEKNAFEYMSECYRHASSFSSSLKEYFKNHSLYRSVCDIAENRAPVISDKKKAKKLFGENMFVSASRVEDYYNCAFRYFCKFGLKTLARKKAEIDPLQRGTLIHYVLEMILSNVGSKALSKMTDDEIRSLVDKYSLEYYNTQMGDTSDFTVRFKYNYKRLSNLIYGVVIHMAKEFSDSDFKADAFELNIDKDGRVKPELLKLDDGSIQIRGSIDRVDVYEKDGQKYVRVVDYKSGNKTFNLSDIMNGLNLQMFIYLFAAVSDKDSDYFGIPAGVLYMHASRKLFNYDSKKLALSKYKSEESSSFRMAGVVLDDEKAEIAKAMEHSLQGNFIPVKANKNGELTGKLITLSELGCIHKKINSLIIEMGNSLHNGLILRNPVKDNNHKSTCEYCDYRDVCSSQRLIKERMATEFSDDELKEELNKEFGENAAMDSTTA